MDGPCLSRVRVKDFQVESLLLPGIVYAFPAIEGITAFTDGRKAQVGCLENSVEDGLENVGRKGQVLAVLPLCCGRKKADRTIVVLEFCNFFFKAFQGIPFLFLAGDALAKGTSLCCQGFIIAAGCLSFSSNGANRGFSFPLISF